MVSIDSATYCNLHVAFSKECELFARYIIYSLKAREDGFSYIADIFYKTAVNQLEHAKIWMDNMEIFDIQQAVYHSAQVEYSEMEKMYNDFSKIAKDENLLTMSDLFLKTAQIERENSVRFFRLYDKIDKLDLFYSENKVIWECSRCGWSYCGNTAPEKCALCGRWQGSFFKSTM